MSNEANLCENGNPELEVVGLMGEGSEWFGSTFCETCGSSDDIPVVEQLAVVAKPRQFAVVG